MSKYQQNDEPNRKITEYERGILYAFYGPVPATSNDEAILLKVKNAVEAAEPELIRLRAENEKLRAALDCFMGKETPTQWRYGRNHAEELAKGILAAAALKETGDD